MKVHIAGGHTISFDMSVLRQFFAQARELTAAGAVVECAHVLIADRIVAIKNDMTLILPERAVLVVQAPHTAIFRVIVDLAIDGDQCQQVEGLHRLLRAVSLTGIEVPFDRVFRFGVDADGLKGLIAAQNEVE